MTRLAAALMVLGAASPLIAAGQSVDAPRAQITTGAVQGLALPSGVRSFRGIPYAAPPERELRWQPPRPAASWEGVRLADRFADQCMQARVFGDMMFRNAGMSEDCLYVNVWTPVDAAPGARLPVLFYVYGGGWVAGDGSEPRYDGESMAKRGIVVVTLSHRLGIFGFFSHPELAAESPQRASGNYGHMDQAAALRWVRDNIASFGGDPAQVTVAGESAGSFAVSALMASPMSSGLFSRAIGESGAYFSTIVDVPSRQVSERNGVTFAQRVGATSLADLRALSATELLESSGLPGAPSFRANIDGAFLQKSVPEIFAAGEQARVPLLAGWNSQEAAGRGLLRGAELTTENARAVIAREFGARAAEAERLFPTTTLEQAEQSLTDLASDQFTGFATWKWLEEHVRTSGQPVYRYFYTRPRPAPVEAGLTANLAGGITRGAAGAAAPPPPPRGAVHAAEIEYAMGNLPLNKVFAWTPDDYTVSATMQGFFERFIKTGDPNGTGLPRWQVGRVGPEGEVQRMRIDVESRTEVEPRGRYILQDQANADRG